MKGKKNILVAWIGGKDILNGLKDKTGPILSTLQAQGEDDPFHHVYLLYNYSEKDLDAQKYISWLKDKTKAEIQNTFVPLASPQDLGEIYLAADKLLSTIRTKACRIDNDPNGLGDLRRRSSLRRIEFTDAYP
jgi:hypothetical protein